VAFARLSLARGKHGRLQFKRTYVFDYTAEGITRHRGFVVVQADSIESIGFASHDAAPAPTPAAREPVAGANGTGNIFYLDQWRREHRQRTPPALPMREERGGGDSRMDGSFEQLSFEQLRTSVAYRSHVRSPSMLSSRTGRRPSARPSGPRKG
jgi:hypothetical protein